MGWPIGWTDLNPMPEFRIIPLGQDPACSGEIERIVQPRAIKRRPARIKMLGNGQVPYAMMLAFMELSGQA